MAYSGTPGGGYGDHGDLSSLRSEGREPGARRKKIAGYLKAANDLRQSYFSQDGDDYSARDGAGESGVEGPGGFPEAAVVRSGNEEMILFPSYARRHVKRKTAAPLPASSDGSEQEYWRREFDRHQDDNAIVDVDVRGWIYTPHRGQTTRKQRLLIGLARQLAGVPAPTHATGRQSESSHASSRASSPYYDKHEEEMIAREAENIVRKGEEEQRYARRGAFSEAPGRHSDGDSLYTFSSQPSSRESSPERGRNRLSQISTTSSTEGDPEPAVTPLQKRTSWQQPPAKMTSAELAMANNHLLNRIKPFMHNGLANSPISCFFYNESCSRQHTVYTNPSGHFTCRAPLDFVPTHVRVLAGEKLSATEEVTITSPKGVSLISDIDDTVKHSEVGAGARQIFRNAFTKELDGLTIDGVKEWYNTMHDMGVSLHYVSNSPWQMYPVLTSFFKLANLPRGSFHLKQYSGYLQGIFEPVAERKKSSLEKIMTDFPDRKFILVGDSGEADLEVYTDVALDYPGRVLGIFIRDVTTPVHTGYFDPSNGSTGGGHHTPRHFTRSHTSESLTHSKKLARPNDIRNDDADLKAAITASLADMEEETRQAKKSINPDSPPSENAETPKPRPILPPRRSDSTITGLPGTASPEEDLIDFSDAPAPTSSQKWLAPPERSSTSPRSLQSSGGAQSKATPSPPPKPRALRSPSPSGQPQTELPESSSKTPPPRPRKPSSAVKAPSPQQIQTWSARPAPPQHSLTQTHQPSPLSQVTPLSPEAKAKPSLPERRKQEGMVLKGLTSTHKGFAPGTSWESDTVIGQPRSTPHNAETPRGMSTASRKSVESLKTPSSSTSKAHPPPPPPRLRKVASYSTTAARKAANRLSGGFDDGSAASLPGSPSEAGMGRKEFLWNQRWARAKAILDRQGVTLRTWRIGADVADVCVKLAELAIRDIEKESKSKSR